MSTGYGAVGLARTHGVREVLGSSPSTPTFMTKGEPRGSPFKSDHPDLGQRGVRELLGFPLFESGGTKKYNNSSSIRCVLTEQVGLPPIITFHLMV